VKDLLALYYFES